MDSTPGQNIDVDLLHLKDMRDGICRDADDALKPGISDANGRIFRGLTIGATSQSGELDASRRALAYAMDRFFGNSVAHIDRVQQVINFLDGMIEDYRTADDLATLSVDAVMRRLTEALPVQDVRYEARGFVE
jgi:hypothetical protein